MLGGYYSGGYYIEVNSVSEEEVTQSEEKVAHEEQREEAKPEGIARIPNREKGSSKTPPFIMMGIFVAFAILSLILARLS